MHSAPYPYPIKIAIKLIDVTGSKTVSTMDCEAAPLPFPISRPILRHVCIERQLAVGEWTSEYRTIIIGDETHLRIEFMNSVGGIPFTDEEVQAVTCDFIAQANITRHESHLYPVPFHDFLFWKTYCGNKIH
jgi:hypothetical protein